jgi:hypothetical protein
MKATIIIDDSAVDINQMLKVVFDNPLFNANELQTCEVLAIEAINHLRQIIVNKIVGPLPDENTLMN